MPKIILDLLQKIKNLIFIIHCWQKYKGADSKFQWLIHLQCSFCTAFPYWHETSMSTMFKEYLSFHYSNIFQYFLNFKSSVVSFVWLIYISGTLINFILWPRGVTDDLCNVCFPFSFFWDLSNKNEYCKYLPSMKTIKFF